MSYNSDYFSDQRLLSRKANGKRQISFLGEISQVALFILKIEFILASAFYEVNILHSFYLHVLADICKDIPKKNKTRKITKMDSK